MQIEHKVRPKLSFLYFTLLCCFSLLALTSCIAPAAVDDTVVLDVADTGAVGDTTLIDVDSGEEMTVERSVIAENHTGRTEFDTVVDEKELGQLTDVLVQNGTNFSDIDLLFENYTGDGDD